MVDTPRSGGLWQQVEEVNQAQRPQLDAVLERLTSADGAAVLADVTRFGQDLAGDGPPGLLLSGAQTVVELLEQHAGFGDNRELTVGLPVFGAREVRWADVQSDAAEVLFRGSLAALLVAEPIERHTEVLIHTAVGADTFSVMLREVLLGRRVPDLDRLNRRPPRLVDLADLSVRGCVLGIRHAFNALAQSVSFAKAVADVERLRRTWAEGITALNPNVGCAGTEVTIRGSGFGASRPPRTSVLFPRRGGGCTEATVAVGNWSDTEVTAVAPSDVGVGCVGFTSVPDLPERPVGTAPLAEAVSTAAGEMETCIGLPAMAAAQRLRDRGVTLFGVRRSCPSCLPGDVNRFRGGRPIIHSFTSSAKQLLSGDSLDLSWNVENATSIEIRTRRVNGSRHELPDVPATVLLNATQGTHHVAAIPGTWLWRAEYELRAINQCAPPVNPEIARVEVTMSIRRPTGFLWGAATAGYQVEGGIANNDWHFFTTNPSIVQRVHDLGAFRNFVLNIVPAGEAVQHGRPVVAMTDAMRGRLIGMNAYRFSVEWSRIEPTRNSIDGAALDYYASLARNLIQHGIEPIVTLSHLTLPLWVLKPPAKSKTTLPGLPAIGDDSDAGFQASLRGWENTVTVDEWVGFVQRVVERLADAGVRYWNTLNEPVGSVVGVGYIAGVWPPGFSLDGAKAKLAYGNLLRAHVRAFLAIKAIDPGAQVGLAHQMAYYKPSDPLGSNVAAANQEDYFYNWHFLDSVTSGQVDVNFARRPQNRIFEDSNAFFGIPTADWISTLDFIGVNYYRAIYAYHDAIVSGQAGFVGGGFEDSQQESLTTDVGWEIYPDGLLALLTRIRDDYGLPVLITENGCAESADVRRAPYLVAHVDQVRRAIDAGVDVLGYLYWSLLDNFEWQYNFESKARFGLWTVNRFLRDNQGAHARGLTNGALAFQHLAEGDGTLADRLHAAVDRYGSFSDSGDQLNPPSKSPGALWEGTSAGVPFALYLSRMSSASGSSRLAGMIFDGDARRWARLEQISWNASTRQLRFFVPPGFGVAEREYQGTLAGSDLAGNVNELGAVQGWQATRAWLEGTWTGTDLWQALSFTAARRWEAPLPAGVPDRWVGKGFASGQASEWTRFAAVRFAAPNVQLWLFDESAVGAPDLTAVLAGTTLQGTGPLGPWTVTRAPDDVLN